MPTISSAFELRRTQGGKSLIPFLTAGYPSADRAMRAIAAVCETGADLVEIGFPHSDPLADGPVIQKSSHVALQGGFNTSSGLAMIRELSRAYTQPFVVMCYYNPILQFGLKKFVLAAAASGVRGLIVPDLIVEESRELRRHCLQNGIDLILLITPTTPAARVKSICAAAAGFIYLVSVTGVTGVCARLNGDLSRNIARIRQHTRLPVCVGFGISSAEAAAQATIDSDGAIIGSRLLQIIDSETSDEFPELRRFLTEVRMHLGGRR